jgi:hypothetical protein
LITQEERSLVEPVDQADQEELVVLAAPVVMVDRAVQGALVAVAVAAAQEHGLTVRVLTMAAKLVVAVELVLLAELEVSASRQAVQAVPELQMLAGEEALQVVDPVDSAATEEI